MFENHREKSHSTLRAKRAEFTFLMDKSSLKMPKIVNFGEFLKAEKLNNIAENFRNIAGKLNDIAEKLRNIAEKLN